MKISKKIFAILLAAVLALSVFAVGASAAGTATGDEWMTVTLSADKGTDTYEMNEEVIITATIACNYNAPTFRFPILFDKTVLDRKTLIGLEAAGTCATSGSINSNVFTDGSYVPENYDPDQWGVVLVQWVGNVQNGAVNCINNPEGEVAFSFKLVTKNGSAGKTGTVFIPAESDKLYYQAIEDPTVATSFYYMNADTCTMTFNPANVTVAAADVALVPNALFDSTAVVDEDNLVVYGLSTDIMSTADMKEYVAATGGATISVDPAELGYGTGTVINLKVGGAVVKSYTAIIFGDTNGDAQFTSDDVLDVLGFYGSTKSIESIAVLMAADIAIPQDGDITSADVLREIGVYGSTVSLNQADPYAE